MFEVVTDAYGGTRVVMPTSTAVETRDQGIRRAGRGRDETANMVWRRQMGEPAVRRLAARGGPFTAEDVRREGAEEPVSPAAWGALFNSLARAGVIRCIGWTTGQRAASHGRGLRVWQGTAVSQRGEV